MKHLSPFKNLALACCTVATLLAVSACSNSSSPMKVAYQLQNAATATVYSFDDTASPVNRDVYPAGPLPARAQRALYGWLRNSTVKEFSYIYPQYFISVVTPGSQRESVWGICSDGQGNMVGVLIPRNGRPAWDAPFTSEHTLYVCETSQRKALGNAIMESLADAGYDKFRIDTRKASGLTQQRYLISKPLSDAAQKKYDLIKKAEEQAAAAREAAAARQDAPAEDEPTEDDSSSDEESTDELLEDSGDEDLDLDLE
ncbi:MAG: hypothetical protein Q4F35_08665 [Akkermansia sp.]|nr:hypothetical protein [Akkermansia sp.]